MSCFIPSSVYKEMRTPGVAYENRAGQLVENVLCQVKIKPTKFNGFIDGLNNYESNHSGIVEFLRGGGGGLADFSSKRGVQPLTRGNLYCK